MMQPLPIDDSITQDPDWSDTDAQAFMNQPQIWPTFSQAVAAELYLTTGGTPLTPVPKLEARSESFKPLQVFYQDEDLRGDTVTTLKKKQTKIVVQSESAPSDGDGKQERPRWSNVQKLFKWMTSLQHSFHRKNLPGIAVNLDEITHVPNIVPEVTFNQSTSRTRHASSNLPSPSDQEDPAGSSSLSTQSPFHNVQTRHLQFILTNVYARRFDARRLLGCRLKPAKRFPWRPQTSIRVVLETYIAKRIRCVQRSATNYPGEAQASLGWRKELELEHCPIAFRYAKLKLDRDGVIDDVIIGQ